MPRGGDSEQRTRLIEEVARHMSADAKVLDEDPETGALMYCYVRTDVNHCSMTFTYVWMAITEMSGGFMSFGRP